MNKEHIKKLQNYSYYLLGKKEYSVFELKNKFSNYIKQKKLEVSNEEIDNIIYELQKDNYQSDDRVAFYIFKNNYLSYKGINFIKQKLAQKKINFNIDKIKNFEKDFHYDFFESCKEYTLKKYDSQNLNLKEKSKIYNHLTGRGFSSDEIRFAIKSLESR